MKLLFFALASLTLSFALTAQTNLYNQLSIPPTFYPLNNVQEHKSNYYALSYELSDSVFYPNYTYLYPLRYSLYKFNISSHSLTASAIICGDTTQADSTLQFLQPLMDVRDGRVHLAYLKRMLYDSTAQPGYKQFWWALYYKQLDTNLNITVPETRLKLVDNTERLVGLYLQHLHVSDKVIISFFQADTNFTVGSSVSRFIQLDLQGNFVKEDSLGTQSISISPQNFVHQVTEVNNYPGNKYLVSGDNLYKIPNGSSVMFYLADSSMQMLDTFAVKPFFFYNPPDNLGYFSRFPNLLALPTGSIIGGGEYYHGPAAKRHTAIIKCTPDNRFTINKLVTFKSMDTADAQHRSGPSLHNLVYNKIDNCIYYADVTHSYPNGPCLGNENYIQVICVDTNLNLKWRKFILPATNLCSWMGYVEVCDDRPGILISGGSYDSPPVSFLDPYFPFIYHLDSAIVAGISDAKSAFNVRDRIKVYPNPTQDYLYINDLFSENGKAFLYDTQGKLLQTKNYSASSNEIPMREYPLGLYFIKLISKDGETFFYKLYKE